MGCPHSKVQNQVLLSNLSTSMHLPCGCPFYFTSYQPCCSNPFRFWGGETCGGSLGNIIYLLQPSPKRIFEFQKLATCLEFICNKILVFIFVVKIKQGDLCWLYVDPRIIFHGGEFNTFRFLADDTSLIIEQDYVFCYNREEDHLVFKVLGDSHMATMRSVAFPCNGKRWTRLTVRWSLVRCNGN